MEPDPFWPCSSPSSSRRIPAAMLMSVTDFDVTSRSRIASTAVFIPSPFVSPSGSTDLDWDASLFSLTDCMGGAPRLSIPEGDDEVGILVQHRGVTYEACRPSVR